MKIAIRLTRGDEAEGLLVKLAGISAVAHLGGLIAFSVMPRFMEPPRMPRATIAEIVPASALSLPSASPQAAPSGPTPTQRAQAARKAQKPPAEPPRPRETKRPAKADPKVPPLEPRPRKPPEPEPPASSTQAEPEGEPQEPQSPAPEEPESPAPEGGISFGGSSGPGGIPSIGSSAFPYDYYRSSLVSVLQSNWRRPVTPEGLSRTLSARVQFTILKSGIIQDPKLVERSGHELLDQSALRAVYDSNPLPPLPFQYGHASVTAEVLFELTPD